MDASSTTIYFERDCVKNVKVDLIDVSFGKDGLGYYLSPKYRLETDRSVREIYIPKARLPINYGRLVIGFNHKANNPSCDFGLGELLLYADDAGHTFYETVIEEKTKEMTLEEIEKKLGHKVKIVSKV